MIAYMALHCAYSNQINNGAINKHLSVDLYLKLLYSHPAPLRERLRILHFETHTQIIKIQLERVS